MLATQILPVLRTFCGLSSYFSQKHNRMTKTERAGLLLTPATSHTHIACCLGNTSGHLTYSGHNFNLCDPQTSRRATHQRRSLRASHPPCTDAVLAHKEADSLGFMCPWVRTALATVACQKGGPGRRVIPGGTQQRGQLRML